MEKPEYREAWAWVHLMLRGNPAAKKVLHNYLQSLRTNANPGPLMPKLREAVPKPGTGAGRSPGEGRNTASARKKQSGGAREIMV